MPVLRAAYQRTSQQKGDVDDGGDGGGDGIALDRHAVYNGDGGGGEFERRELGREEGVVNVGEEGGEDALFRVAEVSGEGDVLERAQRRHGSGGAVGEVGSRPFPVVRPPTSSATSLISGGREYVIRHKLQFGRREVWFRRGAGLYRIGCVVVLPELRSRSAAGLWSGTEVKRLSGLRLFYKVSQEHVVPAYGLTCEGELRVSFHCG